MHFAETTKIIDVVTKPVFDFVERVKFFPHDTYRFEYFSISERMSSAFQAVVLSPSLTGFGKRPSFTPSHQLLLPIGKILRIAGSRRNPVSGREFWIMILAVLIKQNLFNEERLKLTMSFSSFGGVGL
jgi:hypothetical protein